MTINPKHMSASDMLEHCQTGDLVELIDRMCGNVLDREKLKARIEREKAKGKK